MLSEDTFVKICKTKDEELINYILINELHHSDNAIFLKWIKEDTSYDEDYVRCYYRKVFMEVDIVQLISSFMKEEKDADKWDSIWKFMISYDPDGFIKNNNQLN